LQRIAREGKRFRTTSLDIRVVVTPNQHSRIGFIVPKHGRSAVHRNRLKRALRESTRHTILGVLRTSKAGRGMDIVIRALPTAYAASFGALRDEVDSLPARLVRLRDASATAQDGSAPSSQ
jgi:ribonuclease P protein component